MTVFKKIDNSYKPWHMYHEKKDKLEPTHSIVDADGPTDLYCVAFELPNDKNLIQMMRWMNKEIDTQTRFSLSDGKIQVEIEVWDEDIEKKLYFAGDLTFKQCIKLLKTKSFNMGFVPVGSPNVTIAGIKMFKREDLAEMVRIKHMVDSRKDRPDTWVVG